MNKLLVNFCRCFLLKKKNKRHFSQRYRHRSLFECLFLSKDFISMMNDYEYLKGLQEDSNKKINDIVKSSFLWHWNFDISNIDIKNAKELLLKNLSSESEKRAEELIDRMEKSYINNMCHGYYGQREFFTKEHLLQLAKCRNYMSNIEKFNENGNDYYILQHKHKLPINHFESSVFYYKHGMDTLKTFNNMGDKAIIDAGCFIADSCLVFREYTKNKIYTFEANKINYELALKTIELNNLQDVVVENIALGDKQENLYIKNINSSGVSTTNNKQNEDDLMIKCITLDSYVKEHNIKVGLIKVDIEGFEQNFLKGAMNTIKEQKPILLLSIYHNASDFFNIKQ